MNTAPCPRCKTILEVPVGALTACGICGHEFTTDEPCETKYTSAKLRTGQNPEISSGTSALVGSACCFAAGIVLMASGLAWFFVFLPLFLVASILAIVAIAHKRVWLGTAMLLAVLTVPTLVAVISFYIVPAMPTISKASVVADPTSFDKPFGEAKNGDARAQTALGWIYAKGDGVPKDDVLAALWYRKSAEQGNSVAQYFLGLMYAKGEGVPKDLVEAVKWYTKSAEQEYEVAQRNLGLMYANGDGVPKDAVEAVKWFRKSAELGNPIGQLNLGWMYAKGDGVPKDAVEAVKWYRKSAEQGHALAQFNLGLIYAKGEGVPKDAVEALKWYRKSADQGNSSAQFNLKQFKRLSK